VFLTSFFSILPVYGFQKIGKFLCCFIVYIRDFIKKFCKTMVFVLFDILFSILSICTCQKILEIFMFFYFMD